jgi:death-on-curing protein
MSVIIADQYYYFEPGQIKRLNSLIIKYTGGSTGSVNEANLEFVCSHAKTLSRAYSRVAAHYLYRLAYQAHAFTDGNKRTALEVTMSFLELNGFYLDADDQELLGMALLTARGVYSEKQVEEWLKPRIKRK